MIKTKTGQCADCPPGGADKPLTAGRCQFHYWKHREAVNKDKKSNVDKREEAKQNTVFFASQVPQIPKKCEECGKPLVFSQSWMIKAAIAHILPKAIFETVRIHPQNRWFGCLDCHTDYDNRGAEHVVKMKIFARLKGVVQNILWPLLTDKEKGRVPDYFKP